ncbi:MAG: tetratricopeptide repeat protein [Ignavibacteria bacterium]|nr:tetratricopeptide repeat protein [Ignavibacteria bacterium]
MAANIDANDEIEVGAIDGTSEVTVNETFKRNALLVGGGVLIIALAMGLYWYMTSLQKDKEASASLALSRVKVYYERADYDKALKGDPSVKMRGEPIIGLQEIVENYGGTSAAKMAALMSGDILTAQKKYAEAEQMYEAAQGSDSKIITAGAKAGIAACRESEKKYSEAAPLYEEAAQYMKDVGDEARFRYFAAINYEKAGDIDKAKAIYTLIAKENRDTEFKDLSVGAMARLGMIIE